MAEHVSMVGYTRVSKADGSQVHHLQHDALIAAGVDPKRIYKDSMSGTRDSRPGLREYLDQRLRARSHKAELTTVAQVSDLERRLEDVVHDFIEPLYERFDGYRPSIDLVANQLSELKRQPGFGARGG
jgi:DNA invertase Pin-like site-specific DNA recombinase